MPNLEWNSRTWGDEYPWDKQGDEWSRDWGSAEAQWVGTLYPRLSRFVPCRSILEIAPGMGRWSQFLIPLAGDRYVGLDIAAKCVENCRERFKQHAHAEFVEGSGTEIPVDRSHGFDLVFSFDSLVHADASVMESYIGEILPILSDCGVAWIHHSNFAAVDDGGWHHGRDNTVSADVVQNFIERRGGKLLVQELINWGDGEIQPLDCITMFAREGCFDRLDSVRYENLGFMAEAVSVRTSIQPYLLRGDRSPAAAARSRAFSRLSGAIRRRLSRSRLVGVVRRRLSRA